MPAVTKYLPLVRESAARWGAAFGVTIAPELVLAVMQAENPAADAGLTVYEPNGRISRGLMSVLDTTAAQLGLADPELLYVPAVGIDYGVRYLGRQLARYQGSVPRAVAAYNAGSARYTESEAFVNQSYVDRVLRFLGTFTARPAAAGALGLLAALALGLLLLVPRRN